MHYTYKTGGTCSTMIDFDIIDGKLHNIVFTNGCNGNLKAIGSLLEGADPKFAADLRIHPAAISLRVQYGRRSANKLFCSRAAEDAYHKHKKRNCKICAPPAGSFGAA